MKIQDSMAMQRVVDLTRERSAELKKNELTHDFMAQQGHEQVKKDQQKVPTLEAKAEIRIRKEPERNPPERREGKRRRKKDDAPMAEDPNKPTIVVEARFPDDEPMEGTIDIEI